jgi:hypothetical protein
MLVGQPARIAARHHGGEELDADHETDNQIAEAQRVVDEQRDRWQRQADGEIACEQRRDDARRRDGKDRSARAQPGSRFLQHMLT